MEALETTTPPPGAGPSGGHWQDELVSFQREGHLYKWRGKVILRPSATGLLKSYFPQFNSKAKVDDEYGWWKQSREHKYRPLIAYCLQVLGKDDAFAKEAILSLWESDGAIAAKKGTYMHDQFEAWFLGWTVDRIPEVDVFEKWFAAFNKRNEWELYAPEKVLVKMHPQAEELIVWAGSADLLLKHRFKPNTYALLDYKRIRQPQLGAEPFQRFQQKEAAMALPPFQALDNNKTNYYTVQLCIYAYTLFHDYGIDCRNHLYLLQFYGHTPVNQLKVPYLSDEMDAMFALEAAETLRAATTSPSDF